MDGPIEQHILLIYPSSLLPFFFFLVAYRQGSHGETQIYTSSSASTSTGLRIPRQQNMPMTPLLPSLWNSKKDSVGAMSTTRQGCCIDLNPRQSIRPNSNVMWRNIATQLIIVCFTLVLHSNFAVAAVTATTTTTGHLHTGQKVANFFRQFGLPDLTVLAIISALPVVELRGAVPVGVWMGYPIATVLPVCVLGNMLPIVPLLVVLRNDRLQQLMAPILNRAEKKTAEVGMGDPQKRWVSLAAFVGIPLPGTGAWTGAMGAFLLGMPFVQAFTSILTGVVAAGVIMSAITLAGKKGGIAGLAVLLVLTAMELFKGDKKMDNKSAPNQAKEGEAESIEDI